MSHAAKPAEFSLSPSKYFLVTQLGLTICAGLLVAVLPILLFAKIVTLFFILAACVNFYLSFRRQKPQRLRVVDGDAHRWRMLSLSGDSQQIEEVVDLQLEPNQFVSTYLVILYLRDYQGVRLTQVIPRDSLSPQEHRVLRKLLLARASRY
jgi:hypothetical protein